MLHLPRRPSRMRQVMDNMRELGGDSSGGSQFVDPIAEHERARKALQTMSLAEPP